MPPRSSSQKAIKLTTFQGVYANDRPRANDTNGITEDSESTVFLPSRSAFKKNTVARKNHLQDSSTLLPKLTYPPEHTPDYMLNKDALSDSLVDNPSSSRATVSRQSHEAIPASVVFARNAAPLYLPLLDNYLASLPKPDFSFVLTRSKDGMFPPMEQLMKLKMSLDDLEFNSSSVPFWHNRKIILGSLINWIIGLLGSSALAAFYSLQGLVNTVQIFALILSTIVPVGERDVSDSWRKLFLGTIPNILALNFGSALFQSLFWLILFFIICAGLLYYFYRSTLDCDRYGCTEGLQHIESKGRQYGLVAATFLLTVIYLPLSTMSVHVLVWSDDLWAVKNPYLNATSFPPDVTPIGPPDEFRDPLDFCWTTTMKRNEINYSPVVILLSLLVVLFLSIWFPITLRRVIRRATPKVERHSELGRRRNEADMDAEYHRLLSRDTNPFAFLYSAFRRGWESYIATYLFAKLSTLLVIAVIDSDNCLFRSFSRPTISIVRQVLLLTCAVGFFAAQCKFAPFLDPVSNASEWISRLNYVTTATTALLIALDVPGKDIIDTYVLYSIYLVTYGLSFYFSAINLGISQRLVKRLTRRVDFSIDIFSPRLDISSSSIHAKRRIWQESITTLLLTSPECRIPRGQSMVYAQSTESVYPPYLLDFKGSPGERHAENLKILRDVGSLAYNRAVALTSGPDFAWYRSLQDQIQKDFTGPDCYWKSPSESTTPGCRAYFGNAWWIPFPPTLVIRYDGGGTNILQAISDLEAYMRQNSSSEIQKKRHIRMCLRALNGDVVYWPYDHIADVGSSSNWWSRKKYKAISSVHYKSCVFKVTHRGYLTWNGLQIGSGFGIVLQYSKKVQVTGEIIGLNDDFDLTPPLARFLEHNHEIIHAKLPQVEDTLFNYRHHCRRESRKKARTLSYRFLTHVYEQPREPSGLAQSSIEFERDLRVRSLMLGSEAVFEATYARLASVTKTETGTWWYIFWDDLWRRNHDTISGLQKHASDFNPHYPTSIAYTPLPRAALESFLRQRGLLHNKPKWNDFFHNGFLNKMYLRLNDIVFRSSKRAITFHLGNNEKELEMEDIDALTQGGPSSLGTGGGTDHDDDWIRARQTYRWEALLDDPKKGYQRRRRWLSKLEVWFGVTPLWRSEVPSDGISVDVRLVDGRYVLLDAETHLD